MRRVIWPLVVGAVALWLALSYEQRPITPADAPTVAPPALPAERPVTLTALADGGFAVGGQGGGVWLRKPDGAAGARWVAHGGPVRRIVPVDGDLITAGDGSVARWSLDGERRWRKRLAEHTVNDVALADGGAVIVAADRGSVARIDGDGWHARGVHGRSTFAVAAAPDGQRIASGGADGAVVIWSTDGRQLLRWTVIKGWVTALAWTDDGLVVGDSDGRLSRWQPTAGEAPTRDWQVTLAPEALVGLAVGPSHAVVGTEAGSAFRVELADGRATPLAIEYPAGREPDPLSAVSPTALMTAERALWPSEPSP